MAVATQAHHFEDLLADVKVLHVATAPTLVRVEVGMHTGAPAAGSSYGHGLSADWQVQHCMTLSIAYQTESGSASSKTVSLL